MVKTTARVRNLRSPIRDKLKMAKELEANGKEIFYFNVGDPNRFDFDTPEFLKKELIDVIKGKVGYYSKSEGDGELIEAIIERERKKNSVGLSKEDVVVTQGVNEGILFLAGALVEGGGDGILLPGPGYPPYIQWIKFFGGNATSYRTIEEEGWEPDIDDIRKKITDKTKMLVIINPNNPTGAVYRKSTLKQLRDIAAEHKIALVADEIYDEIVFGDEHFGLASVANDVPVIVLNGFSKRFLIPGWRIGYMYFHDPTNVLAELKEGIKAMARQRQSANTPIQKACAKAFDGPRNHIIEMNKKLKERSEFAHRRLNEINGITAAKPNGAFYIFPEIDLGSRWKNDEEFCLDVLRNTGIVFPYGSGFDATYGKGHFRSIFLPKVEVMERAFDKLEDFMNKS